jgi:serine/threonine protein phosphatase PrpC
LALSGVLGMNSDECPVCARSVYKASDRSCEQCGSRWSGSERKWEVLCGPVGAVSDRGSRRGRNEDSCAVAIEGDAVALVVCDGVASTEAGDIAASIAARVAIAELRRAMPDQAGWPAAVATAALAAQEALDVGSAEDGAGFDGATTMVAALARPGQVVIGNVGDSRAYWVDGSGDCELLTVDDSPSAETGEPGLDYRFVARPLRSHEITAWLGPGAGTPRPHVAVHATRTGGHLVACSDGLWSYAPSPTELAALVRSSPSAEPIEIARTLVRHALVSGGADNITVAVAAVPRSDGSDAVGTDPGVAKRS